MASGDKEHRMLFDIRGRRRNVVKVIYAVLAVLMGGSLFLTVGPFSIAEVFNDDSGSSDLAKPYQEQAERIEVKLKKDPENPALLTSLTRAQINAGNAQATVEPNGQRAFTTESVQEYQKAYQSWSEYLKATDEPSADLALVVSPTLIQLAELSTTYPQAEQRVKAATEAQEIVAEQRPSVGSLTTLSFYTYFTGDFPAAEKARAEAKKMATSKPEREAIDAQLDEYEKAASRYLKQKKKFEEAEKAARERGGAGQGAPEEVENPLSGGGLTGGGLGE